MTVPVQITGLLGLAESATVDDTVAAIKQLQESEQVALNRAQTPDLTKFVPVETHNLALNRAETAEQRLQQLEAKEAEALVDAAIEAGKWPRQTVTCSLPPAARKKAANSLRNTPEVHSRW